MPIPSVRKLKQTFEADVRLKTWRAAWKAQSAPLVFRGAQKELFDDLVARFAEHEAARRAVVAKLKTKAAVLARARVVQRQLRALYGLDRLPPRTPLHARVTDAFRIDGCRVQHVIFESRPGLYVTANLYLPDATIAPRGKRLPAALHVCGHATEGKAAYQETSVGLAQRGIAVLAIDPAGQGERDEYADRKSGRRTVMRACRAHGVAGDPMYLTGSNFGAYRLWDCMRALDFLQSRPEIDPKRLGVTGRSGGGWESLWLAALDPRISAVNSNCYLTTLRRRVEARHEDAEPDPEQDPFGILARGLDLPDLLLACLPHCAVSLGATIFDFFPIDGALACYQEAKRLFEIAERPERLAIQVSDAGHANTPEMFALCFNWLSRWLGGTVPPSHVPALPTGDAWKVAIHRTHCTPTGIVRTSLGGKTTAQVHAGYARELALRRKSRRIDPKQIAATLRRLLHMEPIRQPFDFKRGRAQIIPGARATLAPIQFRGERDLKLRGQLWEPQEPSSARGRAAVIYLAEKNGVYAAARNRTCRTFAAAGQLVLDFDPRGRGPCDEVWLDFVPLLESNLAYDAFLLGKPLLGMRVADVLRAVDWLLTRGDVDPARIRIYGEGYGALLALFAGVIDRRISEVTEYRGLASYESLCFHREYAWPVSVILPGVLQHFDLPDLRAALKPRRARSIEPLDHLGCRAAG